MAPKRSVKFSTPGNSVKENSFPRTRSGKSMLSKLPTNITIGITNSYCPLDVPDALKRIDIKTKVALADEVAKSQITNTPVVVRMDPPKRSRGCKKKVVSEFFITDEIKKEPDSGTEPTTLKMAGNTAKKINKKPAIKKLPAKKTATRKRRADSIGDERKVKLRRKVSKPKPDHTKPEEEDNNILEQETTTQKVSAAINPDDQSLVLKFKRDVVHNKSSVICKNSRSKTPTSKPRNRSKKGKQACNVTPEMSLPPEPNLSSISPLLPNTEATRSESPILQPQNKKLPQKTNQVAQPKVRARRVRKPKSQSQQPTFNHTPIKIITEEKIEPPQASVAIALRKCSTSSISNISISNLSWVQEISNSSPITSVSKDIVCFANKLPFIRLDRIDKCNPVNADSDDDSSDPSSSSSDSETSSEDHLSGSRVTPSGCTSLVHINSVNLSSSSRNSNCDQNKNQNLDKKDYERAAEKLKDALNKIDLEFINWLHDTECVTSDLNSTKNNLYAILNNELRALKHCRNIQQMFNPDKNDSKSNTNINPDITIGQNQKTVHVVVNNNITKVKRIETVQGEPQSVENNLVSKRITSNNFGSNITISNKPIHASRFNDDDDCAPKRTDENHIISAHNQNVQTEKNLSNTVEDESEKAFLKPSTSGLVLSNSKTRRRISDSSDSDSSNEDDNRPNANTHNTHDDDDALSLFAESITGIESSRFNASIVSAPAGKRLEEYVPEPVKKHFVSPPSYSYCPTKISEYVKNGLVKTVCEKQNADSTSINKESNRPASVQKEHTAASQAVTAEGHEEINEKLTSVDIHAPNNLNQPGLFNCWNPPRLINYMYRLRPQEVNFIFKGYCYWNMASKCKQFGKPCRYSHKIPDESEVTSKMQMLHNERLIIEYMLLRRSTNTLLRYGLCVQIEFVRRKLTRVVVEIANDFIRRNLDGLIDGNSSDAVVENALLHLNNVDLSVCEDILKLVISDNVLLCDVFMKVMTRTANFGRFKSIFINLTFFMVNNNRTFNIEVAEHILERVCILPFDESIIRALIQIMRLTNPVIFSNVKMENLERQMKPDSEVYIEYMSVKREVLFGSSPRIVVEQTANQLVLNQVNHRPTLFQPVSPPVSQPLQIQSDQTWNVRSEMRERIPLPPSPDTTHLDNSNKTAEEILVPKIIRTIKGYPAPPNPNSTPPYTEGDIFPHRWRHRSILEHIGRGSFSPHRQIMQPQGRPPRPPNGIIRNRQFKQRLVTLGGIPVTYPPPGSKY